MFIHWISGDQCTYFICTYAVDLRHIYYSSQTVCSRLFLLRTIVVSIPVVRQHTGRSKRNLSCVTNTSFNNVKLDESGFCNSKSLVCSSARSSEVVSNGIEINSNLDETSAMIFDSAETFSILVVNWEMDESGLLYVWEAFSVFRWKA